MSANMLLVFGSFVLICNAFFCGGTEIVTYTTNHNLQAVISFVIRSITCLSAKIRLLVQPVVTV